MTIAFRIYIVLRSFNEYAGFVEAGLLKDVIGFLGTPVIALLIGLAFALLLPRRLEKAMLSDQGWVGKALRDAAVIIMITGAGGIFGKVLQNSGLADVIGEVLGKDVGGSHARSAIGTNTLPLGIAVEVEMIAKIN